MYDNGDAEVSVKEQGNTAADLDTVSITGNGTFNIDRTVPTGKKWVLKAIDGQKSAGTYTVDNVLLYMVVDSTTVLVHESSSSSMRKVMENDITLKEGDIIRVSIVASGHSVTGNSYSRALYQEMDA